MENEEIIPVHNQNTLKDRLLSYTKDYGFLVLISIIVLSIYLRLKYFNLEGIWNDEAYWTWLGHLAIVNPLSILTSEFILKHSWVPFIYGIFSTVVNMYSAGKITIIIFSVLGVVLTYLIGVKINGKTLGIYSAFLLTTHHLYSYFSSRALLDVPLTAMLLLVIYLFIRWQEKKTKQSSILLAIGLILLYTTKYSAVIIVPIIVFYLFLTVIVAPLVNNPKFGTLISSIVTNLKDKNNYYAFAPFLIYLIIDIIISGLVSHGSQLIPVQNITDTFMKLAVENITAYGFIFGPFIVILLLLGITISCILTVLTWKVKNQNTKYLPLIATLMMYSLLFLFATLDDPPRHMLPLYPLLIIFSGLPLVFVLDLFKKINSDKIRAVAVPIVILLIFAFAALTGYGYYKTADIQFFGNQKTYSFIGYSEAADWIRDNTPENAIIITESTRIIKMFSEIPETKDMRFIQEDKNRQLYGFNFTNKEEFENFLKTNSDKPIFYQSDIWEYTIPRWIHPYYLAENQEYLKEINFVPEYGVMKFIPANGGLQSIPVIVMYRLNNTLIN